MLTDLDEVVVVLDKDTYNVCYTNDKKSRFEISTGSAFKCMVRNSTDPDQVSIPFGLHDQAYAQVSEGVFEQSDEDFDRMTKRIDDLKDFKSVAQIITAEAECNYLGPKKTYKTASHHSTASRSTDLSFSAITSNKSRVLENEFISIKVRIKKYLGHERYVLYMNSSTQKAREKLQFVQQKAELRSNLIAESNRGSIGHLLKTPVQSCTLHLKEIIQSLKIDQ